MIIFWQSVYKRIAFQGKKEVILIIVQYRAVLCLLIVCSISVLSVSPLFGQAATASISGRVTDASGASIPSAPVTIRNTGTSASQTVNTDNQGRHSVPDLPIGSYVVQATKMGFQTSVRSGVALTVGSAPVIDFQLTAGQTSQSVDVSAEGVSG
jgi:hypothetical protein